MSKFHQNRQSPGQLSGAVWSLAALSAVLLLCSVLAAKAVGDMVDAGLSQVTAGFAASAPVRKGGWGGIDPAVTGSIPRGGAAAGRGRAAN